MDSISGTSGSISSPGIGSGLNVNDIVQKLLDLDSQPLKIIQQRGQRLQTQLSAVGQLQSLVSSLQAATTPLTTASNYSLTTASTTDPSVVSAATSGGAVAGTYSVAVTQLAAAQTVVSASGQFSASTSVVGTGSLTITLGTLSADQTSFTPKTGATAVTVTIDSSSNTLAGIRDKINAANAGVTATIVTDNSGARLALQSSSTGAANGFKVTVDSPSLAPIAFDPPNGVNGLTRTAAAADTLASVNGIAITSSTNSLSNVIQGLTLNVNKLTTAGSPVQLTVANNTDAIKANITSFVAAYNALNGFIAGNTGYDPSTQKGGVLQGDSSTLGLQYQLRSLLGGFGTSSTTFASLASIGLTFQKDGSLSIDNTKLAAAVQNPAELQKALANVDTQNATNNGFFKKLSDWETTVLSFSGTLTSSQQSLQKSIKTNQTDQDNFNQRLSLTEKRLRAQYATLDTTVSQANALLKYVTQQFNTNSSSNK